MPSVHDVVIVGAGQGGLATSYYLTRAGIEHIVVERGDIANAWKADKWDSFCLVTPNWTITLPGAEYAGPDPDGFMLRADFIDHMRNWARTFAAPVRCGVEVIRIGRDGSGFRLETSQGAMQARAVVVATATYHKQKPVPLQARMPARLTQLLATRYRNPRTLPDGAVMVVGAGQTGCQIAEEIREAGRDVYLAVGRAGRLPRRYRGQDCLIWQRAMGWLDRTPDFLERPEHRFRGDPHLSGKNGGHTISLHKFRRDGIRLVGRIIDGDGERLAFSDDLAASLSYADSYARDFYAAVDNHIRDNRILAPEPTAAEVDGGPLPTDAPLLPPDSLHLADRNITSVIWCTGFTYDFSWLDFDVLDSMGYPVTERGVTAVPGLYFMGLNWMYRRKSGIIYGVGEDARHVAAHLGNRLGVRQLI